ncbi:MAG: hypothetical protein ACE365_03890 [Gammaproteobacteria bacterium]
MESRTLHPEGCSGIVKIVETLFQGELNGRQQEIISFIEQSYLDFGKQAEVFSTIKQTPLIMWATKFQLNDVVKFLGDEFQKYMDDMVLEKLQDEEYKSERGVDDEDEISDEVYEDVGEFIEYRFSGTAVVEPYSGNVSSIAYQQKNYDIVKYLYQKFLLLPVDENEYADSTPNFFIKKFFRSVGAIQAGYLTTENAIARPPREMQEDDEERQLMKRISTMLFFNLQFELKTQNKRKNLIEVECMHVLMSIHNLQRHFLFIAANNKYASRYLNQNVASLENFIHFLTSMPEDILGGRVHSKNEGKRRCTRYKREFDRLLNSENELGYTNEKAIELAELLRSENKTFRQLKFDRGWVNLSQDDEVNLPEVFNPEQGEYILNGDNQIILLDTSETGTKNKARHAEEFLVDIAFILRALDPHAYFAIAGKKRPCVTCYGRLSVAEIDNFGERHGYIWITAASLQNEEAAFETCAACYGGLTFYKTVDKEGRSLQDYDSGTDDEDEEYKESDIASTAPGSNIG